jgi:hypothetical protein
MSIRNFVISTVFAGATAAGGAGVQYITEPRVWEPVGLSAACTEPVPHLTVPLYTDAECAQELLYASLEPRDLVVRVAGENAPTALIVASEGIVRKHGPEVYLNSPVAVLSAKRDWNSATAAALSWHIQVQ